MLRVISVQNLKKHFGETRAVDGISFDLNQGEIVGYLGPNGAGKTTTIRCLMDFIRPDEGSVKILGKDARKNAEELKRDIGYLSSENHLYQKWTGIEHINFVRNVRGGDDCADDLIEKLEFEPAKKVKTLSTGNKQKLELILALMYKPKILIMDEPTAGLDPLLQEKIYDTLREEVQNGTSIFMSSHNLSEVERVCDRVLIIKDGKIIGDESLAQLKKKMMYTVRVHFDGKVPRSEFDIKNTTIVKEYAQGLELSVKGDIRPLLAKLAELKTRDLEIKHSTVEDVFLEFYR